MLAVGSVAIGSRTFGRTNGSLAAGRLTGALERGLQPAVRALPAQAAGCAPLPISQCIVPGELLRRIKTSKPIVVLTFDDGPDRRYTLPIANILRDRGYEGKATFFQVGSSVARAPEVTRELSDRGFEIGNHSMRHWPYNWSLANQIKPAKDLIEDVTGKECLYFRSPGLTQSSRIQSVCAELGVINVFTSADERDWIYPRYSAWRINANFNRYLQPGYISLRHDGGTHRPTLDAMHGLIDIAERRGYQILNLGDALRMREDIALPPCTPQTTTTTTTQPPTTQPPTTTVPPTSSVPTDGGLPTTVYLPPLVP